MASVPTHHAHVACSVTAKGRSHDASRVTTDHVMPLLPRAQQMVLPPAPVRPWFCRSECRIGDSRMVLCARARPVP